MTDHDGDDEQVNVIENGRDGGVDRRPVRDFDDDDDACADRNDRPDGDDDGDDDRVTLNESDLGTI